MTLPNTATLKWDGQQIKLQIASNELGYQVACHKRDFHQAMQYRIMIDDLKRKLKEFHEPYYADFDKRYPMNIHVGGQTREG